MPQIDTTEAELEATLSEISNICAIDDKPVELTGTPDITIYEFDATAKITLADTPDNELIAALFE